MIKRRTLVLFGAVAALAVQCLSSPAEEPSPLDVVLTVERPEVALFEPVVLKYALRNPTDSAVTVRTTMNPTSGRMRFYVKGPDGVRTPFIMRMHSLIIAHPTILEPGDVLAGEVVLLWQVAHGTYAFPAPADYTIEVEIITRVGDGKRGAAVAHGELAALRVLPLTAEQEEAIEYFGDEAVLRVLQELGPSEYCENKAQVACFEDLKRFLAEFSSSPYAPFVSRSLANFVSTGRMEGVSEDEGLQLAEEFLQAWPNHPLRRQMTETVVLHLVRQERQGMATDLLDDYEMRWPGFKARSASLRSQLTTATRN